jgi:hypothetical protein
MRQNKDFLAFALQIADASAPDGQRFRGARSVNSYSICQQKRGEFEIVRKI